MFSIRRMLVRGESLQRQASSKSIRQRESIFIATTLSVEDRAGGSRVGVGEG